MRKTILILVSIFTAIYSAGLIAGIIDFFSDSTFTQIRFVDLFVLFLFLIFLAGYILVWSKEKIAGYIFLAWYTAVIFGMGFIFLDSDGMEMVLGLPAIPLGVLFIVYGYRKTEKEKPGAYLEWKLALRILSPLYLILYVIFAISEGRRISDFELFSYPDIVLLGLYLIFLAGFIFYRTKEHFAGFIFIAWYILLIAVSALIPEIGGNGYIGLYALMGSTILVQGLFYINYWYRLKPKK